MSDALMVEQRHLLLSFENNDFEILQIKIFAKLTK